MIKKVFGRIVLLAAVVMIISDISGCALIQEMTDRLLGKEPPGLEQRQTQKPSAAPEEKSSTAKPSKEPSVTNAPIDISDIDIEKLKKVNIIDLYQKIPELFDQIDVRKIDLNNIDPKIISQIKPETLQKLRNYLGG